MGERLRIVALPFPMQGHINPLLQLSHQLAASGIDVTFVTTFRDHERLVGSRSAVTKVYSSGIIKFVGIPDGSASRTFDGGLNESLNASLIAAEEIAKPFENLIPELGKITCIISDGYLGWSQAVASKYQIPRVALWTSNVAYSLVNYFLPVLVERGYAGRRRGTQFPFGENELVKCIPGLDPIHPRDLPTVLHYQSENDPGFVNRIGTVRAMKQAAWILVNSFEELERPGVEAMRTELGTMNYVTVGPLLLEETESRKSLWSEDDECLRWLDMQKPGSVLYISFGSIATISAAQMRSIAKGLEESKQPFLWAMRPNLLAANSECGEEFFKNFRHRTNEQGLIVAWAPQIDVLQHPAVGGHFSHCGWNSVMESMLAGVPILGWPCVAEQSMNCKRIIKDWRIGLGFNRDQLPDNEEQQQLVSDVEVSRVIKKLFSSNEGVEEIRRRAQELSVVARSASKPGGSSRLNLEKFVFALKSGEINKSN